MIEQHIWIGWNESSHRQMKSTISFKKCWWECSSWSRKVRVRRWHGSFGPKRSGPKNRQDNDAVVKTTRHRMVHKKIRQRESRRRKTCTIVQALRMNLCQNIGHRLFHWWIIKPTSSEGPRKPFNQNDWRKWFFRQQNSLSLTEMWCGTLEQSKIDGNLSWTVWRFLFS